MIKNSRQACFASISDSGKNCEYIESRINEEGLDEAFCRFYNSPCKNKDYYCDNFIEEVNPYKP